jgi:hypothetical protein
MDFPNYLYKFRYFDEKGFHLKLVSENELYFPSPLDLNDPFDCRIPTRYFDASPVEREMYLRELGMQYRMDLQILRPDLNESEYDEEIERNIQARLQEAPTSRADQARKEREWTISQVRKIGIFSGSMETTDNSPLQNHLLWAHYAKSHTGFCVKLDLKKLETFWNSKPTISMPEQVQSMYPAYVQYDEFPHITPYKKDRLTRQDIEKALTSKSSQWSYEKECRLIAHKPGTNRILRVSDEVITDIYLGLDVSDKNKQKLLNLIVGKSRINIFQAEYSDGNFDIDFERI